MSDETINLLTKMSIAYLKCNPGIVAQTGKPQDLCHIYGEVVDCVPKTDKRNGEVYYPLHGDFEAQNIVTGAIYRSGVLYLPAGLHEMLSSKFLNKDQKDKPAAIQFGLTILAVPANNPVKYSYEARPLLPPSETDRLATIRKAVQDHTSKLVQIENKSAVKK